MVDAKDPTACQSCGVALLGSLGPLGLCPACLLGLAFDEDPSAGDDADDPIAGLVYRVMTVLSGDRGRTTYLAERVSTRGLVTLEVVKPSRPDEAAAAEFRSRLAALERLDHPHIARVVDGRVTPAGEYCVVSTYVSGPPLDRYCVTRGAPPAERTRLVGAVAGAVEYAHAHGVVHGRLRADTILVAGRPDPVQPVLTAFGMWTGRAPSPADDVEAVRAIARALGWRDELARPDASIGELRQALETGWPPADRGPGPQNR
jgi:hypothetical protein